MRVEFTASLRIIAEQNARFANHGHLKSYKDGIRKALAGGLHRAAMHDQTVKKYMRWEVDGTWIVGLTPPLKVTLTRFGAQLLDADGMVAGCKVAADELAGMLWLDDGPKGSRRKRSGLLTMEYRQEIGPYALRVEIEEQSAAQEAGG